jgi:hypothetical protein
MVTHYGKRLTAMEKVGVAMLDILDILQPGKPIFDWGGVET